MSDGGRRAAEGRVDLVENLYDEIDVTASGPRAAARPARPGPTSGRRAHRAPAQVRPPGATADLPRVVDDGPPTTALRPLTRAEAGTRGRQRSAARTGRIAVQEPVPLARPERTGRRGDPATRTSRVGRIAKGPVIASFLVSLVLVAVGLRFLDPPETYTLGVDPPETSSSPSLQAPTSAPSLAPSTNGSATPSASGSPQVSGSATPGASTAPGASPSKKASASRKPTASTSKSSSARPVTVVDGADFYVSPNGSDSAKGSASSPFKTLDHAMEKLRPGDTLVVGDGVYRGDITGWKAARGTSGAPITVKAAPGANPVVVGKLWFSQADYWRVSGINVKWDDSEGSGDHMVKFQGGTGFSFTDAEVSGAKAYAGILVADDARAFRLARLYVHDTVPTHGTNQDHLIYVNTDAGGGVIEYNVLADSPNGRAIKVGPPSGTNDVRGNLTIRYNTMYNNGGPSNVQLSGNTRNVEIYRNIMVKPSDGYANVTVSDLSGSGNVVRDNVYFDSSGVLESDSGLENGGGNVKANPRFRDAAGGDFRPANSAVAAYGRYAA